MAMTAKVTDTAHTGQAVADPGSTLTPATLVRALARPQVASTQLAFEARMVERARRRSLRADAIQRAFDIVVASVALVVAAPLMVVVAVAVRVTSRGPVIFRQTRIGRHGEPFECMKFRTMRTDAQARLAALLLEDEGRAPRSRRTSSSWPTRGSPAPVACSADRASTSCRSC